MCAEDCSEIEECSIEGQVCTAEDDALVCHEPKPEPPPATTSSGCANGGGSRSGLGGVSIVLGLFALVSLRRRHVAATGLGCGKVEPDQRAP